MICPRCGRITRVVDSRPRRDGSLRRRRQCLWLICGLKFTTREAPLRTFARHPLAGRPAPAGPVGRDRVAPPWPCCP